MRWLRRLLQPAEDPRAMRGEGARAAAGPDALLARLDSSLADLAHARERLEATAHRVRQASPDDPLGQGALGRIEAHLAAVIEEERQLRSVQARLLTYLAELQARQAVAEVRCRAAAAQVRVGEALAGLSEDFETVAEAAEWAQLRAEALKTRAAILGELA